MRSPIFVIYQIGAGSDGGLNSIGEIIARAPFQHLKVITNKASDYSKKWERNAEVAIWTMEEGGYRERRRVVGRLHCRLINNFRMFIEIRRSGTTVVHLNDHCALWNAAFGAKLAGAKIIFNVRDGMRDGASVARWRFYLWLSDRFLVLSRDMEDHWREKLAPLSTHQSGKFRHLYSIVDRVRFYPIDAEQRRALRDRLGIELGRSVLVYVGRFDEKKAQLAFIREALPSIVRERGDVMVFFIGDFRPEEDSYAARCQDAVHELGLSEHVGFIGYVSKIEDWYRAADLILLASQREGLARCMIEGIACGTPMVSFAVCSAKEILEEHGCGLAVPLHAYSAFARAVLALLNDDDTRCAMAARGSAVSAMFAPERNASAFRELLRELQ